MHALMCIWLRMYVYVYIQSYAVYLCGCIDMAYTYICAYLWYVRTYIHTYTPIAQDSWPVCGCACIHVYMCVNECTYIHTNCAIITGSKSFNRLPVDEYVHEYVHVIHMLYVYVYVIDILCNTYTLCVRIRNRYPLCMSYLANECVCICCMCMYMLYRHLMYALSMPNLCPER